jgi:hypothetical protein
LLSEERAMADRRQQVPLAVLDLTVGAGAAGMRSLARWAGAANRLAGQPARAAWRAGQAASRRVPAGSAIRLQGLDRLRSSGHALRNRAQLATLEQVHTLVRGLVEGVLDQLDLTDLVVRRVDLDRVADGLDVDAVVARVDLDAAVARVDLDAAVARVDLDAAVARVDLDAVADRLDLIRLAEYVVDGIDLPKIIRESTGSVASEGLRGVRMQSIEADQALAQLIDRVLLRRRPRRADSELKRRGDAAEAGGGSVDGGSHVDGAGQ